MANQTICTLCALVFFLFIFCLFPICVAHVDRQKYLHIFRYFFFKFSRYGNDRAAGDNITRSLDKSQITPNIHTHDEPNRKTVLQIARAQVNAFARSLIDNALHAYHHSDSEIVPFFLACGKCNAQTAVTTLNTPQST